MTSCALFLLRISPAAHRACFTPTCCTSRLLHTTPAAQHACCADRNLHRKTPALL
jgi:hypothetical protein